MSMTISESHQFTEKQLQRLEIVYALMRQKVYPVIKREMDKEQSLQKWDRKPTFFGLFLRSLTWAKSVCKLNEPTDLQPILVSVRSLLETAVDLQLLRYEQGNPCWKMYWWEESGKLKAALAQREYYKHSLPKEGKLFPSDVPDEVTVVMEYIDNEETNILDLRRTLWPTHVKNNNPKHPERWTGSGSFLDDVRTADKTGGKLIKYIVGKPLEEFYETQYRRLSWNVHGSGLAVMRNLTASGVNVACGYGYVCSSRIALLCTKLVIDEFGVATELQIIDEIISEIITQSTV